MNEKFEKMVEPLRLNDFPDQNPNPVFRVSLGGFLNANASAKAFLAGLSLGGDAPLPDVIRQLAAKTEETPVLDGELTDDKGRTFWYTAVRPGGSLTSTSISWIAP